VTPPKCERALRRVAGRDFGQAFDARPHAPTIAARHRRKLGQELAGLVAELKAPRELATPIRSIFGGSGS